MTQPSPEIAAAVEQCPCPHQRADWRSCPHCTGINAELDAVTAERARLHAAVLALAGDSYVVGVSAVLALFEVPHV